MAEIWEHEPDLRLGGELNPFVVDDQDDVVQIHDEEEVEEEVAEVIDITEDDLEPFERGQGPKSRPGEESLPSFLLRDQGFYVRPGITVELKEPAPIGKYAINFLRITSIIRQAYTDNVTIRGHGFTRAKNMNGMLPKQLNECCLIALVDTHDFRPWKEQAIIDIKPENVLAERNFRITNAPFPQYADHSAGIASKRQQVKDMGVLVSRYSYIEYHQTDERKPREWTLLRAGEDEADENLQVSAEVLVNGWRGGKIRGGSHVPVEQPQGQGHERRHGPIYTHDLDDPTYPASPKTPLGPAHISHEQKYTAGDTFAGAGGASRGISDAGLHLEFCVDNWEHAVASLKANFQGDGTTIYDMDMHDFIVNKDIRRRVDILHLSPPCQVWSPAHTRPGQNDEKNLAILFSCTHLIEKIRPRLFTVEQTFGMLHQRFEIFFQSLVRGFTDHGYSVRWKVVSFSQYGLPQPRRRLIMIGAGPGEKLPPFPPPTHGLGVRRSQRNGGLKPLTTARQALSVLDGRRRHPLHQPYLQPFQNTRAPWDGDQPLPYTVTCGAAENYHWSGLRRFTPREYALLQGFPVHHKFAGNYVKKQIGNAFPPVFVKVLYKHLVNWLDSQDNVVRVRHARVDGAVNVQFRTPTAQRHINIERREEDQEVTFLSSHKRRRALFDSVELIDDDDGRVSSQKRARLNATPGRPKQKMVIDLDGDMSNLVLDLDQDQDQDQDDMNGRSDSATICEPSVDSAQAQARVSSSSSPSSPSTPFSASADSNSARNPPSSQRPVFHHTPSGDRFFMSTTRPPHPLPSSPLGPGPRGAHTLPASSSSSSSSSSSNSNSMQGEKSVRRKLFFTTKPPPRPEPFSSPSSTSSTSSSGTGSGSSAGLSSSDDASNSPRTTTTTAAAAAAAVVEKENQSIPLLHVKGTKEEPMELSD